LRVIVPEPGTCHITHVAESRQPTHAPGAVGVVPSLSLDEGDGALQVRWQHHPGLGQLGQSEGVSVFLEPLPSAPGPLTCSYAHGFSRSCTKRTTRASDSEKGRGRS